MRRAFWIIVLSTIAMMWTGHTIQAACGEIDHTRSDNDRLFMVAFLSVLFLVGAYRIHTNHERPPRQ